MVLMWATYGPGMLHREVEGPERSAWYPGVRHSQCGGLYGPGLSFTEDASEAPSLPLCSRCFPKQVVVTGLGESG
jgi:hypothetical protein